MATTSIECVFFDLDDCLYKNNWSTANALDAKFGQYCEEKLSLTNSRTMELCQTHGTTLCGLIREGYLEESKVADFLSEVHQIRLDISPDLKLRDMLLALPHRRWVFTASTRDHAQRCLRQLGIADLFEGIIACSSPEMFERVGYVSKHDASCFRAAMDFAGVARDRASGCVFLDDSVKNIKTARSVGWYTVLVGRNDRQGNAIECPEAHVTVDTLHEVPEVLPWLFEDVLSELAEPSMKRAKTTTTKLSDNRLFAALQHQIALGA